MIVKCSVPLLGNRFRCETPHNMTRIVDYDLSGVLWYLLGEAHAYVEPAQEPMFITSLAGRICRLQRWEALGVIGNFYSCFACNDDI